MPNTPTPLEQSDTVTRMRQMLSMLDRSANHDDISTAIDMVQLFHQLGKEFTKALDAAMLEWIEANNRDIVVGDVRYYAGVYKTTKCTNPTGLLDALLTTTGGDMDRVCKTFASNAFKHGACRDILEPDKYDELFVTEERPQLKEGKPVKQVLKFDQRFMKGGNATSIDTNTDTD